MELGNAPQGKWPYTIISSADRHQSTAAAMLDSVQSTVVEGAGGEEGGGFN